jgi:hypothetical protein
LRSFRFSPIVARFIGGGLSRARDAAFTALVALNFLCFSFLA